MNFSLSPDQEAVQNLARQVAQDVKTMACRNDREGRFPQDILEGREGF